MGFTRGLLPHSQSRLSGHGREAVVESTPLQFPVMLINMAQVDILGLVMKLYIAAK
jgi:hypothetical protein